MNKSEIERELKKEFSGATLVNLNDSSLKTKAGIIRKLKTGKSHNIAGHVVYHRWAKENEKKDLVSPLNQNKAVLLYYIDNKTETKLIWLKKLVKEELDNVLSEERPKPQFSMNALMKMIGEYESFIKSATKELEILELKKEKLDSKLNNKFRDLDKHEKELHRDMDVDGGFGIFSVETGKGSSFGSDDYYSDELEKIAKQRSKLKSLEADIKNKIIAKKSEIQELTNKLQNLKKNTKR